MSGLNKDIQENFENEETINYDQFDTLSNDVLDLRDKIQETRMKIEKKKNELSRLYGFHSELWAKNLEPHLSYLTLLKQQLQSLENFCAGLRSENW